MWPTDQKDFSALLAGCMESIYDRAVTPAMLQVWFVALAQYPLDEIRAAFGRHITDPDQGQYPPKPADIVRMLDGGGDGRALTAWAKVEKAVRCVGGYRSVVFDDPLVHACIDAMGGWIKLCSTNSDELPFRANEFAKRYRAYLLTQPECYPPHLAGRAEMTNGAAGYPVAPPIMIGAQERAMRVMLGGKEAPAGEAAKHGLIAVARKDAA